MGGRTVDASDFTAGERSEDRGPARSGRAGQGGRTRPGPARHPPCRAAGGHVRGNRRAAGTVFQQPPHADSALAQRRLHDDEGSDRRRQRWAPARTAGRSSIAATGPTRGRPPCPRASGSPASGACRGSCRRSASKSIDTQRHVITHAVGIPQGIGSKYTPEVNGTRHGDGKEPWYALNLLEEIDQPGEWCIHFPTRKLYFWPPEDLARATVLIADMDKPLVTIRGASHVTLRGLTIEAALGPAVRVEGGEDVRIAGCTIRNAGSGVDIVSGKAHRIESCDLYEIGAGALHIAGGDRVRLEPAGHLAVNNHIHHCGRTLRTVEAVLIEGVGNRFARNLLHDLTYGGVRYLGNDHVMEGNEIHNIGLDGGDLGALLQPVGLGRPRKRRPRQLHPPCSQRQCRLHGRRPLGRPHPLEPGLPGRLRPVHRRRPRSRGPRQPGHPVPEGASPRRPRHFAALQPAEQVAREHPAEGQLYRSRRMPRATRNWRP